MLTETAGNKVTHIITGRELEALLTCVTKDPDDPGRFGVGVTPTGLVATNDTATLIFRAEGGDWTEEAGYVAPLDTLLAEMHLLGGSHKVSFSLTDTHLEWCICRKGCVENSVALSDATSLAYTPWDQNTPAAPVKGREKRVIRKMARKLARAYNVMKFEDEIEPEEASGTMRFEHDIPGHVSVRARFIGG